MHIADIFTQYPTTTSFEFFPPKNPEASEALYASMAELEALHPSFVSVTYGAGGSTRDVTHDLVVRLKKQTALDPIPHLTCVCHTEAEIRSVLDRYAAAGISNVLALGGDVPKSLGEWDRSKDAFRFAADLVKFIRTTTGHPDPRGFGIGVAGFPEGHPSTPNRIKEMDYLKAKVDAGADYICTQLFFDNHDFYDFRDRCTLSGIKVPIIAGIMPVTSAKGLIAMADMALGCHYPAPLLRAINRTGGDPESVRRVGVHWATEQCRDLLDNDVRGIHFYTLNKSTATREIYANLGLKDSRGLTDNPPAR